VHQTTSALARLVRAYDDELAARRAALLRDRSDFLSRLAVIEQRGRQGDNGLARLYREHVRQIEGLLLGFAEPRAARAH